MHSFIRFIKESNTSNSSNDEVRVTEMVNQIASKHFEILEEYREMRIEAMKEYGDTKKDKKKFIDFYARASKQKLEPRCQCIMTKAATKELKLRDIEFMNWEFSCNFGNAINLPASKGTRDPQELEEIDFALEDGTLDYLHSSAYPIFD